MAWRRGPSCFLVGAQLLAAGWRAWASGAAAATRNAGAAIPEWRIDAALHPTRTLRSLVTDGSSKEPKTVSRLGSPLGSTLGQDRQRCPLVKLPDTILMSPEQASWSGQSGVWESFVSGIRFASWGQNYFSQGWETTYVQNQDERLALKAEVRSFEDLKHMYGWRPGPSVKTYENITNLERESNAAAYIGYEVTHTEPNKVQVVAVKPPPTTELQKVVAFTDCEGQLLFVITLEAKASSSKRFGNINVFDRDGSLLAHSIVNDPKVANLQFVDTQGYLLATAESPGLHKGMLMKNIPRDPTKGNILPFAVHFEEGGYANASRLLDIEYRWVLALATQVDTISEAHGNWTPRWSSAVTVVYWCLAVFGLLACMCTGVLIYYLVFPSVGPSGASLQPLWAPGKPRRSRGQYSSLSKSI